MQSAVWLSTGSFCPSHSRRLPGLTERCVNVRAEDEKVREDTAAEVIQTAESSTHAVGVPQMNKEQTLHV